MINIYNKIKELQESSKPAALCTIVFTRGSTPLKAGAKMIVMEDGSIYGTIGGGNLEKKVIENALRVIREKACQLFNHDLLSQHGMCCGGKLDIFIEPIMQANRLYIFGAGHVGKAIAKYAMELDFEIFVIDDRKDIFNDWDFKGYNKLIADFPEVLPTLPFNERTYSVIATYEHSVDREILAFCLKKPFAYLGMIGSRKKVELTKKMMREGNFATPEVIARVKMPIGVDIKALTHHEIAISIVAELVKVKNDITV